MVRFWFLFCFVILNFACISSPPTKFEAKIPKDDSTIPTIPTTPLPKDVVYITLKKDGKLFLNEKAVGIVEDTKQLRNELKTILDTRTPPQSKAVLIKAPRSATYGSITKVVDVAKSLNAEPIGLNVDEGNQ